MSAIRPAGLLHLPRIARSIRLQRTASAADPYRQATEAPSLAVEARGGRALARRVYRWAAGCVPLAVAALAAYAGLSFVAPVLAVASAAAFGAYALWALLRDALAPRLLVRDVDGEGWFLLSDRGWYWQRGEAPWDTTVRFDDPALGHAFDELAETGELRWAPRPARAENPTPRELASLAARWCGGLVVLLVSLALCALAFGSLTLLLFVFGAAPGSLYGRAVRRYTELCEELGRRTGARWRAFALPP